MAVSGQSPKFEPLYSVLASAIVKLFSAHWRPTWLPYAQRSKATNVDLISHTLMKSTTNLRNACTRFQNIMHFSQLPRKIEPRFCRSTETICAQILKKSNGSVGAIALNSACGISLERQLDGPPFLVYLCSYFHPCLGGPFFHRFSRKNLQAFNKFPLSNLCQHGKLNVSSVKPLNSCYITFSFYIHHTVTN